MLAYDYPLFGLFWSMLWFFLWIAWLVLLFRIIGDIFRSHDLRGFAKALWLLLVILLPLLGTAVYLLARGDEMGRRQMEDARARDEAMRAYVRSAASTGGSADDLASLADLRARGAITEAEFSREKAKVLS